MEKSTLPEYYYQLKDSEDFDYGILKTDMPEDQLNSEWSKYYNHFESNNMGVEEFIEQMENAFAEYTFEQIWIQSNINP